MVRTFTFAAALGLGLALAGPAAAQDDRTPASGDIQLKVFVTGVLPDGKIKRVPFDGIGLPAGTQTKANDNITPTIAAELFVNPNLSLETICCVTRHKVTGTGALAGARLVSDINLVPLTLTAKYHLNLGGGLKPYVGAGPSYFLFIDEDPGATTRALGATRQKLSDEFGLALQAGADIPLGMPRLSASIDAKRYFVSTTAQWFAGRTEVLRTRHKLDPWVVSAGVAYRY